MKIEQEPKYRAVAPHYPKNDGLGVQLTEGHLVNRHTGEAIPHDEPVFVFRARDKFAAEVIDYYLGILAVNPDVPLAHGDAVLRRLKDFQRFAEAHPERMKVPDTP